MNISTPHTQLASPVVLGDSELGEEVAPLVTNDIAIDEDEDEDDTQQYLNTSAIDDGGLLAQQYEYSGSQRHASVPELPPPKPERTIEDLPPKCWGTQ